MKSAAGMAAGTIAPRVGLAANGGLSIPSDIRSRFPRVGQETYLNAAGMMPLGDFSIEGLRRHEAYQQLGGGDGRGEYVRAMQTGIRGLFADLVGAEEREIGLVHCTKAGEQIVLDALSAEFAGGKGVVTNDLHFAGSLHNLLGLQESGLSLKIVRAKDWKIRVEEMVAAIDGDTGLVSISLVSNINGHIEDIRTIADAAHAHGALLFADIIQAVGITPVDVRAMGIDVASCSCYKWLYGVHGTGFLYVRHDLQGTRLPDRLFPGQARHNYAPWVSDPDLTQPPILYHEREDATRYQPGHVSYQGYCAAYEGLKFLAGVGVEAALAHNVRLNRYLLEHVDAARYRCITPDVDRSPIVTLLAADPGDAIRRLRASDAVVSYSDGRIRVSPALYSNEADMDRLAEALG
jgi:selenocysteine lyase/cysteine desulfurase